MRSPFSSCGVAILPVRGFAAPRAESLGLSGKSGLESRGYASSGRAAIGVVDRSESQRLSARRAAKPHDVRRMMSAGRNRILRSAHKAELSGESRHAVPEAASHADPTNERLKAQLAEIYGRVGDAYMRMAHSSAENWKLARDWEEKSLNIWDELRGTGKSSGADNLRIDQVTRNLALCDAAIALQDQ
jgi:hypothetical protein